MQGQHRQRGMPERIGEQDGVSLRIWEPGDEVALQAAVDASHDAFLDWLPGVFKDTRDVRSFVVAVQALFGAGSAFLYAVLRDGEVVGQCSLHRDDRGHGIVGYWVRTDRTGRGTATIAVRLLCAAAFAVGFQRLELRCDVGNTRSAAVARRAGFEHVSTVPVEGERTPMQSGEEMVWELLSHDA